MKHTRQSERGAILLGILLMLTIVIIGFAAYAPSVATQIKRDREEELLRRGRQYSRAIQLYFRKFGRYPNSIEQLENTNNLRFLRKKYTDPITGKDEWRIIRFGQQKARTPRNFGKTGAGGSGSPGGPGTTGGIGGLWGQGGMGGQGGLGSQSGQTNQGQGSQQSGLGLSAEQISRPLSGSATFGGGLIMGVSSTSEKRSLKELDGRNKYNEWEFLYDPSQDPNAQLQQGGQQPPGARPQQGGQPQQPSTGPRPQDRR